jgi:hypothetical protein
VARSPGGGEPQTSSGAEQATTRKRGGRGNGRRLRRRIADAQRRRERATVELAPFDPWRRWVLARVDAEIEQLRWELRTGWTGEPGEGPRIPRTMPLPARPGVLPREIRMVYLPRPWRVSGPAGPLTTRQMEPTT